MTAEDRQKLRAAALRASIVLLNPSLDQGPWSLQTSNSFRRIGARGDGDVLCATVHPIDHHPDLLAPPGVLDYIVAAQPRVVLDLLDYIEDLERRINITVAALGIRRENKK